MSIPFVSWALEKIIGAKPIFWESAAGESVGERWKARKNPLTCNAPHELRPARRIELSLRGMPAQETVMRAGLAVLVLFVTSVQAAPDKAAAPPQKAAAPSAPSPAAELQQKCASRMYAERASHPRGAVNWNVYDRCMRQAGAKP